MLTTEAAAVIVVAVVTAVGVCPPASASDNDVVGSRTVPAGGSRPEPATESAGPSTIASIAFTTTGPCLRVCARVRVGVDVNV